MPIDPIELPALSFSPTQSKQPYQPQTNKIGWLRAIADKEGVSFDMTIRDGMGRIVKEWRGCKTDTNEYGELINLSTVIGDNLEVEVTNLKGADKLDVFLN